jgi:hypothetical protein
MTFLPIVERELRIAARRPWTYRLRSCAALMAIIIMLLTLWGMGSHLSPVYVAKEMFGILSVLTLTFCVCAGMFQIADCLSSEKREGTLGLLFLTDLQGYDVVLGKLAANSLHACYGLMSVLPIIAIPLLAGGVTGGEFWRIVLVLLTSLFFSMGVGMFVSSVTRETRQALGITGLIILLFVALLPAIQAAINLFHSSKLTIRPLLWPSLAYAFGQADDSYYNSRTGHQNFWGSILTILAIGISCLLLASFILPRTWQEKSQSSGSKNVSKWRKLRFGTLMSRQSLRETMSINPFHWLAIRDRLCQISFWILAGLVLPLWLLFLYGIYRTSASGFARMMPFQFLMFTTVIFSVVFKFMVAAEASRRLSDDRQSGALELLLVTTLSEQKIIAGQRRALLEQFRLPILIIELLFVAVLGVRFTGGLGVVHDEDIFIIITVGNMIVLLTDFSAMGWVGMWAGLRSRHHHRAVLLTLLQILVVPWLLYFILGVAGFFNSGSPLPLFVTWYLLGVGNDLIWSRVAREGLKREFRLRAAGIIGKKTRYTDVATSEAWAV